VLFALFFAGRAGWRVPPLPPVTHVLGTSYSLAGPSVPSVPSTSAHSASAHSALFLHLRGPARQRTQRRRNVLGTSRYSLAGPSAPSASASALFGSSFEDVEIQDIKNEIGSMVEQILGFARSTGNINALDPRILTENSHVITKGRLYEEVMASRVEAATDRQEVMELERVDAFLKGFITSERKSRARLKVCITIIDTIILYIHTNDVYIYDTYTPKVNYILAGASSQRLDESIMMLSESDEIDDELLFYLEALVKKEVLRAAGPSSLLEEDSSDSEGSSVGSFTDVERSFMATNKDTLNILRMVQRRLKAELSMRGRYVNIIYNR
jgi:hypothetical protein